MEFHFNLLTLLLLACPVILSLVIYGVCKYLGTLADRERILPQAGVKPRRTYFYPTREIDGNGTDY